MGAGPAVGGGAGFPVGDVEPDIEAAFLVGAGERVVEVEKVGNACAGLGGLSHVVVLYFPAVQACRENFRKRLPECRFWRRHEGEVGTQAESAGEQDGTANQDELFHGRIEFTGYSLSKFRAQGNLVVRFGRAAGNHLHIASNAGKATRLLLVWR